MTKLKRIFSLTIVFLLTFMAVVPVQGLAQQEQALEQAIKAVRAKIQIPQSLTEFSYNSVSEGKKTIWYLDWSSKDRLEGNISVRVDQKGTILGYNFYKPYDYDSARKFPRISRQQAKSTAESFIERMAPGLLSGLRLVEDSQLLEMGRTHRFSYVRLENGIPYHGNTVNVDVNSETGEVQSYYCNWSEELSFSKPEDAIAPEDAAQAYKKQLGLKLIYEYNYDQKDSRLYAVYVPVYGTNYGIDAFSGERIKISPYYGLYGMGTQRAAMEKSMADMDALTPEEQKAVDEVSEMLTRERAESIARGIKELEVSRDYKVTNAYLQKDWNVSNSYTWELSFQKEASSREKASQNIWVRINARNGDLKGYSRYLPREGQTEGKYTQAQARAAAEKFIKAVQGDKFKDMELDPVYEGDYYPMKDTAPTSYSFRYIRKVNGVQFPDNSVYVGFDAVNGTVNSFSMDWFDLDFPAVDNVLEEEEIYDKLFADIGMELVYSNVFEEQYREIIADARETEIRLVYNVKQDKPIIFDAFSGETLDHSGKPFVEKKAAEYTDIDGHFAQNQIAALAEYGISLPGTEFKPDQNIIQQDFLRLLVRAMGNYGSYDDDRDMEEMYNLLIREKVVTKDEKNPNALVTREEAVKYIIRSLKYQDVADIKGIFMTGFKDQDSMNPGLVGYVAIAKGLNIIGGGSGYFNPKNSLTRAETAVMIYNYLTR